MLLMNDDNLFLPHFQLFRSISNTKRSTDFYATHNIQEAGLGKYIAILSPLLVGGGIVTYAK